MRKLMLLVVVSLGNILLTELPVGFCFSRGPVQVNQPIELSPEAAKAALIDMMRSTPGKARRYFQGGIVRELTKTGLEKKKDGWYDWTEAYQFNPAKATYSLFVPIDSEHLRPKSHPPGFLHHVFVWEGRFEWKGGRWIATVPIYKYVLLD